MELSAQEIKTHTAKVVRWWIEPYTQPCSSHGTSWISVYETSDGEVHCGCRYPTLRDVVVCEIFSSASLVLNNVLDNWNVGAGMTAAGTKTYSFALSYKPGFKGYYGADLKCHYDDEVFFNREDAVRLGTQWFGCPPLFP